jgi:hypothetical protein
MVRMGVSVWSCREQALGTCSAFGHGLGGGVSWRTHAYGAVTVLLKPWESVVLREYHADACTDTSYRALCASARVLSVCMHICMRYLSSLTFTCGTAFWCRKRFCPGRCAENDVCGTVLHVCARRVLQVDYARALCACLLLVFWQTRTFATREAGGVLRLGLCFCDFPIRRSGIFWT